MVLDSDTSLATAAYLPPESLAEDWHTNDYPDEDSDRDPAQSEEELSGECACPTPYRT